MISFDSSPEILARELLSQLNLKCIGNLEDFLHCIRLKVKEVDSKSFEGALVADPNKRKGIIAVRHGIREEGRKRFTVCHEVGHFVLPGHGSSDCICKSENIESWRKNIPEHELAANSFASELLLPYKEVLPLIQRQTATISLAKKISTEFGSSLTSASLKCVDVTEESCAFVCSVNGLIKWFRPNDNFKYFIRVNQKVSTDSFAGQIFSNPNLREQDGAVPADAWLQSDNLLPDARIWEDSIFLPYYNTTITILTIHRQIE